MKIIIKRNYLTRIFQQKENEEKKLSLATFTAFTREKVVVFIMKNVRNSLNNFEQR